MNNNRYTKFLSFPLLTIFLLTPIVAMADATELITSLHSNVYAGVAAISDNRQYVLFNSDDTTLVTDDLNDRSDVFLRDRNTGKTSIVSRNRAGGPTDAGSTAYDMTPDGRYILYTTGDSSWSGAQTTALVLLDRATGMQEQMNLDDAGNPIDHLGSYHAPLLSFINRPRISSDGRYVVFSAGPIYVRDRATNSNFIIPRPGDRTALGLGAISADGRFIVYKPDGTGRLYRYDRVTSVTQQVDVAINGGAADFTSELDAGISDDGRYVTFSSRASNLVADDTNSNRNIFLRDMELGVTTRITSSSTGISVVPTISGNGRYIAFFSSADDLVTDDTNGLADIFRYDRETGNMERVSVNHRGEQLADNSALRFGLSNRGDSVVFSSGLFIYWSDTAYARDMCNVSNSPPIARIDSPETIIAQSAWTFFPTSISAAASQDGDGDRLEYYWTYPALDYPPEYQQTIFPYNTDFYYGYEARNLPAALPVGRHTFGLMVDDRCGGTDTTSQTINVNYNFDGYSSPIKTNGRYRIGRTLNIRFGFSYADGSLADDANVLLTITPEYYGQTVVVDGGFDLNGSRFDYAWDTTGMPPGWYRINVNPRDGIGDGVGARPPFLFDERTVEIYLHY